MENKKEFQWGKQQLAGLGKAREWLDSHPDTVPAYFLLGGYAGTGKSTMAEELASTVSGSVYYAAYTGKAANVLRTKTGSQLVGTIHGLIYRPKQRSDLRLLSLQSQLAKLQQEGSTDTAKQEMRDKLTKEISLERENLTRPAFQLSVDSPLSRASLLILDEYSMIDEQIGEDLLKFGCRILALGDPGQLPPPRSKAYFQRPPDVLLTEIHRQALDNPIIRMSLEVREGRGLRPGQYGASRVAEYREFTKPELLKNIMEADQLLVGKNATRTASNKRIRQVLGYSSLYPVKGDKLVCLRNNADSGVFNGQLFTATGDAEHNAEAETVSFKAISEDGGDEKYFTAHEHYFTGGEPNPFNIRDHDCFDYGYALTVHKFQGSQSEKIVLLDEWYSSHRREWLYTGITRASNSILVVQM